jgi:hypothetical protein
MADILVRPLTIQEAVEKSGRSYNTIIRWIMTGQLPTLPKSPMQDQRRTYIDPKELEISCRIKRVPFKQPREPHLFRKREVDKERWRTKYARTPEKKKYHREISRWRRAKKKAKLNDH